MARSSQSQSLHDLLISRSPLTVSPQRLAPQEANPGTLKLAGATNNATLRRQILDGISAEQDIPALLSVQGGKLPRQTTTSIRYKYRLSSRFKWTFLLHSLSLIQQFIPFTLIFAHSLTLL